MLGYLQGLILDPVHEWDRPIKGWKCLIFVNFFLFFTQIDSIHFVEMGNKSLPTMTHWNMNKIKTILQATFWNKSPWKNFQFWLKFCWFLVFIFSWGTTSQQWFRSIYGLSGLNELNIQLHSEDYIEWVEARLQYLQCVSSGDTAVFH